MAYRDKRVYGETYWQNLLRAWKADHPWEWSHFRKFFPLQPTTLYRLVEQAGFSPVDYRASWPDLSTNLPSDEWSTRHFVHYLERETRFPRRFPIKLNFDHLEALARSTILSKPNLASLLRNLVQAQIDYSIDCIADEVFWRHALRVLSLIGQPIIIFGDSHSLTFRQTIDDESPIIIPLNVFCGGGSALGLSNRNSRSGYGLRLEGAISAIRQTPAHARVPLGFTFGQVDIEFVHTFRRLKADAVCFDQRDFEKFCNEAIDRYITWISGLGLSNAVVVGINPPCIDDAYLRECYLAQMQVYMSGGIVEMLDEDNFESLSSRFSALSFPDKHARTLNHGFYNARLHDRAQGAACLYVERFDQMLGTDLCIDPRFACATADGQFQVGHMGRDIHVGGEHALALKARVAREMVAIVT